VLTSWLSPTVEMQCSVGLFRNLQFLIVCELERPIFLLGLIVDGFMWGRNLLRSASSSYSASKTALRQIYRWDDLFLSLSGTN
jgi:hypothetical protein